MSLEKIIKILFIFGLISIILEFVYASSFESSFGYHNPNLPQIQPTKSFASIIWSYNQTLVYYSDEIYINQNTTRGFNLNETKLNATIDDKIKTIYYNATTLDAVRGTTQGVLGDIQTYNGISYNVTEQAGAEGINFIINFTGVDSFNELIFRYKSSAGESHLMNVQIYDYDDSEWENYATLSEVTDYNVKEIGVFDSSEHISGGVVQVRFYQADNGNTNHKHQFDWVVIARGQATPSGAEVDPLSWHRNVSIDITGLNLTAFYGNFTEEVLINNLPVKQWLYNQTNAGGNVWTGGDKIIYNSSTALKVGIGTATPTQSLDIAGNVIVQSSSFPFYIINDTGSPSNSFWRFGMITSGTGDGGIGIQERDGTFGLFIQNGSRNIGVGTINPSANLEITATTPSLALNETDVTQRWNLFSSGGDLVIRQTHGTGANFIIRGSDNVAIFDTDIANKRVIIGGGSLTPTHTLHVNGTMNVTFNSFFQQNLSIIANGRHPVNALVLDTNGTANENTNSTPILFKSQSSGTPSSTNTFKIQGVAGGTGIIPRGYLGFYANTIEALTIDTFSGGVGVWTNKPTSKFNVNGTSNFTDDVIMQKNLTMINTLEMGWTVKSQADTACITTCTHACVMGFNTGGFGGDVASNCTDSQSDKCLCGGPT